VYPSPERPTVCTAWYVFMKSFMCVVVLPTLSTLKNPLGVSGESRYDTTMATSRGKPNQPRRQHHHLAERELVHTTPPSFAPPPYHRTPSSSLPPLQPSIGRGRASEQNAAPQRRLRPPRRPRIRRPTTGGNRTSPSSAANAADATRRSSPHPPSPSPSPTLGNDDCSTRYSVQKKMVRCFDCVAIAAFPAAITCSQILCLTELK